MHRWLCLIMLAGLAGACSEPYDENRFIFGVSADRPVKAQGDAQLDQKIKTYLDSRVNQICTLGYDMIRQDLVQAESGQQLVDWEVRCRPYEFSLF
jgi:hypothetical protein